MKKTDEGWVRREMKKIANERGNLICRDIGTNGWAILIEDGHLWMFPKPAWGTKHRAIDLGLDDRRLAALIRIHCGQGIFKYSVAKALREFGRAVPAELPHV